MVKNLKNGNHINLSLELPDLNALSIGLSWDDSHHSEKIRDLDVSAFMVASDQKIPAEQFFVYYNNLSSPERSLMHQGDNRTGQSDGDDEFLSINLGTVTQEITQIILVASIHTSNQTIDTFEEVSQIRLSLNTHNPNTKIAQYIVDTETMDLNAIQLGRFYREFGMWIFEAMEEGTTEGLDHFVDKYA